MSDNKSISIEMDPKSKVFYAGVAAGMRTQDLVETMDPAESFETKSRYYWLNVGVKLAETVTDGDDEMVELFLQGAKLRAPEQRGVAFHFTIASLDVPAFQTDGELSEEKVTATLPDMLREVADDLEHGYLDGSVTAGDSVVGSWALNLLA
jgi:hypothetical protein